MSEPRWADVEVGDAIIANHVGDSDAVVSGTIVDPAQAKPGARWGYYLSGMRDPLSSNDWTLLDIIKPEPQLPTTPGSVIRYELNGPGDYAHYVLEATFLGKRSWSGPWGHGYTWADVDDGDTPWELIYDAGKK